MNQIKFTGIVIKSIDYKEKDKLLTIFSLELGKVTATLKGVKQEKAKLKFAALPFCFAEFVASEKNGYITITECYQIESFYNTISNYNKSLAGFLMLEVTCIIMQNTPDELWFITLINFLKQLEYGNIDSGILEIKFMLDTLIKIGYGLNFEYCTECGMKFLNDIFLNFNSGELRCSACAGVNSQKLTKQQFAILKLINSTPLEKLNSVKQKAENLIELTNLIKSNLNYRLGANLKSLL